MEAPSGLQSGLESAFPQPSVRTVRSPLSRLTTTRFRNKYLNNCIVLKVVAATRQRRRRVYTTDTLIYFPYNGNNIYEGGDSVLVSDPKRDVILSQKCGFDPDSYSKPCSTGDPSSPSILITKSLS